MALGPVEFIVIEFPSGNVNSDIVPSLRELTESHTIRIIDLMFIRKDANGRIEPLELSQLDGAEALRYEELEGEIDDLVNMEDVQIVAGEMEPGSFAVVIVWEDVWATRFAEAVRATHGRIVDYERVPHDIVEAALKATTAAGA